MYTTTWHVSWPLMRGAWLRRLWRERGGALLAAALLLVMGALLFSGSAPWVGGFFTGAAVLYFAGLAGQYRQARAVAEGFAGAPVRFTIEPDSIRFETGEGAWSGGWGLFDAVAVDRDGLLLTRRHSGALLFMPAVALSPELVEEVVRGVRAAGGRVEREK